MSILVALIPLQTDLNKSGQLETITTF